MPINKTQTNSSAKSVSKYHTIHKVDRQNDLVSRLKNRGPLNDVMFALTYQCNLNCSMCLTKDVNRKILDFPVIKNILDDAAAAGALHATFSGGEVMLRKDFPMIYRYAAEKGFLVTVFTNLTLLNDKIMKLFKEYPPDIIQVTVYGLSSQTYESVTGVKGSFAKFMANLKRIKMAKLRIKYAMTLTRSNEIDMERYMKMAIRPWEYKTANVVLQGRSDLDPCKMDKIKNERIPPEKAGKFMYEHASYEVTFPAPRLANTLKNRLFNKCSPNSNYLYIDTNGDCMLCFESGFPSQRRRYVPGKLKEIAKELVEARRSEKIPRGKDVKCISCPKFSYCLWCPQYARLMGDDLERDSYLCQVMDNFYAASKAAKNKN